MAICCFSFLATYRYINTDEQQASGSTVFVSLSAQNIIFDHMWRDSIHQFFIYAQNKEKTIIELCRGDVCLHLKMAIT